MVIDDAKGFRRYRQCVGVRREIACGFVALRGLRAFGRH